MLNFADAIANIESRGSGGYSALGPILKSGDRAYGRYQVMGNNIGPWTKEILGQPMTPDQFLSDPKAQDAVFRGKFGQYVQQTGSPQDAASMWFTGKPLAEGANLKDVNGTSGSKYVNEFTANLNGGNNAGPASSASMPQMPSTGGGVLGMTPEEGQAFASLLDPNAEQKAKNRKGLLESLLQGPRPPRVEGLYRFRQPNAPTLQQTVAAYLQSKMPQQAPSK